MDNNLGISAETVEAVAGALSDFLMGADLALREAQAAITALLASGEVVLRNTQECADCHAVFSIGPKDIVCRDCARKEPVLQKVGFTCERTQERHTYTYMTDFIMAFLTIKKERDEAKEREVVLRKNVETIINSPAYINLKTEQCQLDEDGISVAVSRQALEETFEALAKFTTKQEALTRFTDTEK